MLNRSFHFVPTFCTLSSFCMHKFNAMFMADIDFATSHFRATYFFRRNCSDLYYVFSLSFWGWLSVWLIQIVASLKEARIEAGMYHGQMSNKAREDSHRYVVIIFIFLISTQHRFCFLKWLLFLFILLLDLTM